MDKYIEKEEKIYKHWINHLIAPTGIEVHDLKKDITPIVLKEISERILQKPFPGKLSNKQHIVNIRTDYTQVLSFLLENKIQTMNCTAENFCNVQDGYIYILSLLFSLHTTHSISRATHCDSSEASVAASGDVKNVILQWVNKTISPYGLTMENFSSSLTDGRVFAALVDCYKKDGFYEEMIKLDEKERLKTSLKKTEKEFEIPSLFDDDEIRSGKINERMMILFFNSIIQAFANLQEKQNKEELLVSMESTRQSHLDQQRLMEEQMKLAQEEIERQKKLAEEQLLQSQNQMNQQKMMMEEQMRKAQEEADRQKEEMQRKMNEMQLEQQRLLEEQRRLAEQQLLQSQNQMNQQKMMMEEQMRKAQEEAERQRRLAEEQRMKMMQQQQQMQQRPPQQPVPQQQPPMPQQQPPVQPQQPPMPQQLPPQQPPVQPPMPQQQLPPQQPPMPQQPAYPQDQYPQGYPQGYPQDPYAQGYPQSYPQDPQYATVGYTTTGYIYYRADGSVYHPGQDYYGTTPM